jgi:two-component system nitrate/nitrite response regulator NarL
LTEILIISEVRANAEAVASVVKRELNDAEVIAACPEDVAGVVKRQAVDVSVMNVPVPVGMRLIRLFGAMQLEIASVAYGVSGDDRVVLAWIDAGAFGCVAREVGIDKLLCVIRDAAEGRAAEIATSRSVDPQAVAGDVLTSRKAEVLQLASRGLSNREIAGVLCLQVPTVKNHMQHVLRKLGARSRGDAAEYVAQRLSDIRPAAVSTGGAE